MLDETAHCDGNGLGSSQSVYSSRQTCLVPTRGKQVIRREGKTRRYESILIRNKAIKPLLAAAQGTPATVRGSESAAVDKHYEQLRVAMQGLFHELGIAA